MSREGQGITPDQVENCLHPRDTHKLLGHEAAEHSFIKALKANKMHHAWLIVGQKGIGKATLAYRMARRIAGVTPDAKNGVLGSESDHPISRQIAAGSYPDLKIITNGWNDKTKKWRNEISVDQIREISQLFANRAAGNGWRICIIDCADNLNRNAANALLKTLEEPPDRGLLILICHQAGKLLPTITSRCRSLKLRPLGLDIATEIAQNCGASREQAELAARLSNGCPGRAAQIANSQGQGLWAEVERIFDSLPRLNQTKLHELTGRLSAKKEIQSLELFLDLLQMRLQQEIKTKSISGTIDAASPWIAAAEQNQVLQTDLNRINLDPAIALHQMVLNLRKASKNTEKLVGIV